MSLLGIGAGKMELRLNRIEFHPGETIEGAASLTLNEQVKARGAVAEFWAEITQSRGKSSYTKILYKKEERLDTEKEYRSGVPMRYEFKFVVPEGILKATGQGNGLLGKIGDFFSKMSNNSIRWYVTAKLDVPMAFDVSARQQLRVTLAPQSMPGVQMH